MLDEQEERETAIKEMERVMMHQQPSLRPYDAHVACTEIAEDIIKALKRDDIVEARKEFRKEMGLESDYFEEWFGWWLI